MEFYDILDHSRMSSHAPHLVLLRQNAGSALGRAILFDKRGMSGG